MKKFVILFAVFAGTIAIGRTQNAKSILDEADSLTQAGNYTEVIALLEKNMNAFDKDSEYDVSPAYYNLGVAYLNIDDYEKAKKYNLKYYDYVKPQLDKAPDKYVYWFSNNLSMLAKTESMLSNFKNAVETTKENITLIEKYKDYFENYRDDLSTQYNNLAYYSLFVKDFQQAEKYSLKALSIDSTKLLIKTNLAHALLFQGKTAEAETIYDELSNTIYHDADTYTASLLDDFELLEKAGIVSLNNKNDFERIKSNMIDVIMEQYKKNYGEVSYPYLQALKLKFSFFLLTEDVLSIRATLKKMHEVAKKFIEKDKLDAGIILNEISNLYKNIRSYDEALIVLDDAIEALKNTPKGEVDYANSLSYKGEIYVYKGMYDDAEKALKESVSLLDPNENPQFYVDGLHWLSFVYAHKNNNEETLSILNQAYNICKNNNLEQTESYVNLLIDYGFALLRNNEQKAAKEKFEEAITVSGNMNNQHLLGTCYKNYGDFWSQQNNDDLALENFFKAKNIFKSLGDNSAMDYAGVLNEISEVYAGLGQFNEAKNAQIETLNLYKRFLGKTHHNYVQALVNLLNLSIRMGNMEEALYYIYDINNILPQLQTLTNVDKTYITDIQSLVLPVFVNFFIQYQNYLGDTFKHIMTTMSDENKEKAKQYNIDFSSISELLFDRLETFLLESKDNLKNINRDDRYILQILGDYYLFIQLDYEKALKYYRESIIGMDKNSIWYALRLGRISNVYATLGNYQQAISYQRQNIEISKHLSGDKNIELSGALFSQSLYYLMDKNYSLSFQSAKERFELLQHNINSLFNIMSENDRLALSASYIMNSQDIYSLLPVYDADEVTRTAYNATLYYKGLLLRSSNRIRESIFQSNDASLINNYEKLELFKKQLQSMSTSINSLLSHDTVSYKRTRELSVLVDSLDWALTRNSAVLRDAKNIAETQWKDVRNTLQTGEAAIEFIDFPLWGVTKWTDSTMYAALVLRPGMSAPEWIPLCEKKQLDDILKTTIKGTQMQTDNIYNTKGGKLYDVVWKPLVQALQDVKTVYYSPSGLLYKIAFNALPTDNENILLSDKYNLNLVSSTREIARLKKATDAFVVQDSTVVYGGLNYTVTQSEMLATAKPYIKQAPTKNERLARYRTRVYDFELPSADLRSGSLEWDDLKGSKKETEEIVSELKKNRIPTEYYTENAGNEESFKHLSGTKTGVIHMSTHGFFLSDIENKLQKDFIQRLGGNIENPLLRSGLIMSGANNQWQAKENIMEEGVEDGILTADEISRLNLTKTKLVILSACETGLGDVKNSEGVFGLQRAFKLAGVESLIMSLWKVPDEATAELMTAFYQQWLSGQSKQSAFKTAQQKVREKYKSPYFWAAFVMMD